MGRKRKLKRLHETSHLEAARARRELALLRILRRIFRNEDKYKDKAG